MTIRLERIQIMQGGYEGILTSSKKLTKKPNLDLLLGGEFVSECVVEQDSQSSWRISVNIPLSGLCEGANTFTITQKENAEILDNFNVSIPGKSDPSLEEEVHLLRQELNLLKAAFRRQSRS